MRPELKIQYRKNKTKQKSGGRDLIPETAKREGKMPLSIPEEQKVKGERKGGILYQTRNSKLLFNFFFIDNLLQKLIWGLCPQQNS